MNHPVTQRRRRPAGRAITWICAGLSLLLVASFAVAGDLPDYQPDANHSRDQVPDVYKWSLDQLFTSVEQWEQALADLAARIPELDAYRGRLSDPVAMGECLGLYFDLHDRINRVTLFANLEQATDDVDPGVQDRFSRSQGLMTDLMRVAGFIRSEILAPTDAEMESAYSAENGPAKYRPYIENLRRRRTRILSEDAERVLALAGDNLWAEIDLNELIAPPEQAFMGMLTDIVWPTIRDQDDQQVQLNLSNYRLYRRSPDRRVRHDAVEAMMTTLGKYQHVLAATLSGQFQLDVLFARARGYDTALEAYMDKDNLDTAVHDNLIATVNANLEPLHRYTALRKKMLGFDELHVYDLAVPIIEGVEVKVPFPEARATILEALEPLGEDYMKVLRKGLDPANGWLDLYPCRGKESGAFSASVYARHPYVKMNYQGTLDDMSTLAHEYGHAMHSYLSSLNQPYGTYRYVPFLAEIASTCNEALLSRYLVDHCTDKTEKANLLVERLNGIAGTIYRQTQFSEFERVVHGFVEQGRPITADLLNETYGEMVQRYYGPDLTYDDFAAHEWSYVPHFYYKYYVYTYATGLSSGLALAEKILAGGEPATEAYLSMLEGGCSAPPLELLSGAGVDLTSPEPIEAALKVFSDTLDELEALLDS